MAPKTVLLAILAGLSAAACSASERSSEDLTPPDNAIMDVDTSEGLRTAQKFANLLAASDRFEVESSRLAEAASHSAAVKGFAQAMIDSHGRSTLRLKSLVDGLNPRLMLDDSLSPEQTALLASVKGRGALFDANYIKAQISAHKATLKALNAYAASGDNPDLRRFAEELIPIVTAHLSRAEHISKPETA